MRPRLECSQCSPLSWPSPDAQCDCPASQPTDVCVWGVVVVVCVGGGGMVCVWGGWCVCGPGVCASHAPCGHGHATHLSLQLGVLVYELLFPGPGFVDLCPLPVQFLLEFVHIGSVLVPFHHTRFTFPFLLTKLYPVVISLPPHLL